MPLRLLRSYHAVQAVSVAGWWGLLLVCPAAAPFFFPAALSAPLWRAVLWPDVLVLVAGGLCMAWRPRPFLGWWLAGAWAWSTLLCVGWCWHDASTWSALLAMGLGSIGTTWLAAAGVKEE